VDPLNIDQSFIRNIVISKDNKIVTKIIINPAKSFNLEVFAQGAEKGIGLPLRKKITALSFRIACLAPQSLFKP